MGNGAGLVVDGEVSFLRHCIGTRQTFAGLDSVSLQSMYVSMYISLMHNHVIIVVVYVVKTSYSFHLLPISRP